VEVVHKSVYQALLESQGVTLDPMPVNGSVLYDIASVSPDVNGTNSTLSKRDCSADTAVITDTTQSFIGWDVQMSPVVIGVGNTGIDVYVSSGYSVSNSVSVAGSSDYNFVKDTLGASLGIEYTRTWTTQTVINIRGNVPNGYSGVMITKPNKTRRYGRTLQGCLGSMKQIGTFTADNYYEGSYSGVKWVSGAITLCIKKQFPLTRCTGSGQFI